MEFNIFSRNEIEDIMFYDLFYLRKRNDGELATLKKKWLHELLHLNLNVPNDKVGKVLFFRSLQRDDYKKLFHSVINCLEDPAKIIVEDYISDKSEFNIEASKFLAKLYSNIKYFNFIEDKYRVLIFVKFIQYFYVINKLENNSFNNIVLFSDMQPLECFASIYFNKKGVKTISLQHGLYIDYYDLETVNVLNYKVQPSTYFLSWGQNTKSLIEKYHSNSKVVICGKPDLKDEATDANISSDKDILIVCDQEIFQKQNFQLIKIVQDFCLENRDWNFKVRFHPHNNKAAYYKTFPNICESTAYSNGQVIVGISSSLLYELGVKGYNVFQFKTNINTIELCVTRQFTSLNSLRELVKSEKKEKSNFTDIIECIGSESEKRYHQFFDAMLGNKGLDFGSEDIPFFTIIIPTYNSSLLIYKAINSLQKQSFKNFEVLIIDGLSTDQTIPITLGLIDRDDRFKIYSQKDCGIYDAMNIGFRKARGKWLYFLGSDDEFYASNILEKVNAHITTNNFDTGMVYGNVEVKGDVKWAKDGTIYDGEFSNLKIKTKNICHQAIFYNRERKKTVGEYNLKYKLCSDWDMNLKVWSKYGGEYLDLTVAYFHAGGVSTAGTDPEFGKDFKLNILEYFGEEG